MNLDRQNKARRFEATVMPHLDAAYNLARWLARDEHDAQDVAQEACLRAFKFFDGFHGGDGRAWLLAIVRNTYYTWLEKKRIQRLDVAFDDEACECGSADAVHGGGNAIENLLQQEDNRRLVNRALGRLPAEFREIVVLRELEDLSYREIAQIVEIPLGTVMSRLSRARKMLLRALREASQER